MGSKLFCDGHNASPHAHRPAVESVWWGKVAALPMLKGFPVEYSGSNRTHPHIALGRDALPPQVKLDCQAWKFIPPTLHGRGHRSAMSLPVQTLVGTDCQAVRLRKMGSGYFLQF
jgi:hypothetical protein